jgi:hypothetical protein
MIFTINTATATTIAPEELDRVEALLEEQAGTITELRAELALRPPLPPAPVPVFGPRLFVDGPTLRRKDRTPIVLRGVEMLYGPSAAGGRDAVCGVVASLKANSVAPLFEANQASPFEVVGMIGSAKLKSLVCGVNADHTGNGRTWICQPQMVAACNAADNVFLECDVELGSEGMTDAQYTSFAVTFVKALRAAGHLSPIKVGVPGGGRDVGYALRCGKEIIRQTDSNLIFTWQAYWPESTNNTWYTSNNGYKMHGTAGALKAVDDIAASGLCFLVGLDDTDNIGQTPWRALAAAMQSYGIGFQWWALASAGRTNDLVQGVGSSTPTALGRELQALFTAHGRAGV